MKIKTVFKKTNATTKNMNIHKATRIPDGVFHTKKSYL